jgi:hypothetical protein
MIILSSSSATPTICNTTIPSSVWCSLGPNHGGTRRFFYRLGLNLLLTVFQKNCRWYDSI